MQNITRAGRSGHAKTGARPPNAFLDNQTARAESREGLSRTPSYAAPPYLIGSGRVLHVRIHRPLLTTRCQSHRLIATPPTQHRLNDRASFTTSKIAQNHVIL